MLRIMAADEFEIPLHIGDALEADISPVSADSGVQTEPFQRCHDRGE